MKNIILKRVSLFSMIVVSFVALYFMLAIVADIYTESSSRKTIVDIEEYIEINEFYIADTYDKLSEISEGEVKAEDIWEVYAKIDDNGEESEVVYVFLDMHDWVSDLFYTSYTPCEMSVIRYDNATNIVGQMEVYKTNSLLCNYLIDFDESYIKIEV